MKDKSSASEQRQGSETEVREDVEQGLEASQTTPPRYRKLTQCEAQSILFAIDVAIAALDHFSFLGEMLDMDDEYSTDQVESTIRTWKRLRRELTRS